jgi:hypothetical protein
VTQSKIPENLKELESFFESLKQFSEPGWTQKVENLSKFNELVRTAGDSQQRLLRTQIAQIRKMMASDKSVDPSEYLSELGKEVSETQLEAYQAILKSLGAQRNDGRD